MSRVPSRSASGVRLGGDDYQHLVTWNEVLAALRPEKGVETITVEARDSGNVDDIVITYWNARTKYVQVKHAVDASTPVGTVFLTKPSRKGRRSLLQRFHASWRDLSSDRGCPDMRLITDREIDPADRATRGLDRRTQLLVPEIESRAARTVREEWANHLGVPPDELLAFLQDLRFVTGRPMIAEIERADELMWAHGLNTGQQAIDAALGLVRDWVQDRERTIDVETLRSRAFNRVGRATDPGALLVVEGIADDPQSEDADAHVRFVECYSGDDPSLRREFVNPDDWQTVVVPALQRAVTALRATGSRRVAVRGAMRLPVWFAVGAALRHVHSFTVAAFQYGELWSSDTAGRSDGLVVTEVTQIESSGDLALAIGIAADPREEVASFITAQDLPVGRLAVITPRHGPGAQAVPDGATAASMGVAIVHEARRLLGQVDADRIHLFLATPAGLALLVGHRWNALRPTVVLRAPRRRPRVCANPRSSGVAHRTATGLGRSS